MNLEPKKLAFALSSAILLSLAACGGGGDSPAAVAKSSTVAVSPALGKFSAGAKITIKSLSGTLLGTGTTDSTGTANVNIGSYTGPMIIEVTGGTGVTYFDENSSATVPFGATDTLSAIAPSVQSSVGVTAATNAAAEAVKSNNGGTISSSITASDISLANSRIASALGITDVLQAPKLVDASTSTTLDIANVNDKYALQLAALAKLASSGKTAFDVAKDLASDLRDNKLDGTFNPLSTSFVQTVQTNAATSYTAGTITATMNVNLISAATSFGTTDTKNLVTADPTIVGTVKPDVTAVIATPSGTSNIDLQKVKSFFAELRTTFRSLSNSTQTGFLDNQATRASTDLNATVGSDMDKVLRRLDTVGLAIRSYEGAQPGAANMNGLVEGITNVNVNGTITPTASLSIQNGSFANVWNGTGGYQYCYAVTPVTASSVVTCLAAGSDSADKVANVMKFIRFDLTPTGTAGAYTYTALRYNRPVTLPGGVVTLGTSVGANGACLATHATGGVNDGFCGGNISKGSTSFTLTGTFPPSTPTTGVDTVAITAAKTPLTAPNTARYALTGTASTADSATSVNTASLSLDTGSQIDVDETNASTTGVKGIALTLKGTIQSKSTKFVGTISASGFSNDASGGNNGPTNVVFNGAISDTSIGGAGEILTGKLEATTTNRASYNGTLPESSSNFQAGVVTFTGTLQAPSRPLAKLVVSGTKTSFSSESATVSYTYGTVSITGSGTTVGTVSTSTVSNQDGVQFAPSSDKLKTLVTKAGVALAEIQNNSIRYVDGITESLQ